jgi:SRSO17 transposase
MAHRNDSPLSLADQEIPAVQGGMAYLADIERRLAPYFERAEPRQRAMAYLRGLLSPAERKNSWQLAEVSGNATPYGFQHLLGRALWDPDAVRDERRRYVVQQLGDADAVLVIDETGFVKKGWHSAGVARQYSGTAGRIENCQIGVFLGYAGRLGHALLDRALYLPEEWTKERERCRQAGIPEDRRFATKPQLAKAMRQRALGAGVPARWVTGDSVYGDDRRLRMWLESQPQAYVLAVSGKEYVWLGWRQCQVKTVLAALPEEGWMRLSAGAGAKGPRGYDWRWLIRLTGRGAAGCCSGGVSVTRPSCGRMGSLRLRTPPWRRWSGWRGHGGSLNSSLKPPKARWGWITTRSAAGRGGIGTSRWPCGPWPC